MRRITSPSRFNRTGGFPQAKILRFFLSFVLFLVVIFVLVTLPPSGYEKKRSEWRVPVYSKTKVDGNDTLFWLHGSWGNLVEVTQGCMIHPSFDAFAFNCPINLANEPLVAEVELLSDLVLHESRCLSCTTKSPVALQVASFSDMPNVDKKVQKVKVTLPSLAQSCRSYKNGEEMEWGIRMNGLSEDRCLIRFDILVSSRDSTSLSTLPPICFAAIGDWGYAAPDQTAVIAELERLIKRNWVKFIVSTGDNFYPEGVPSASDSQWYKTFEKPFSSNFFQQIPFLISIGNHDLFQNPSHQVEYGRKNARWYFPAPHYGITVPIIEKVEEVGSDKTKYDVLDIFVMNSYDDRSWDEQVQSGDSFFISQLKEVDGKHQWRLIINHEAALSSSIHGLDQRRNLPFRERMLPFIFRHKSHMYINGDDHILEVHHLNGTDFITSGAGGGSVRYLSKKRMPSTIWRPEKISGPMGKGGVFVIGPTLHCTSPFSDFFHTTLYDVSTGEEKKLYAHNTLYNRGNVGS